ncbi:MAG: UDP-N-acetylmuramate dehydrogenase [Patescibacteria group bacterium]
MSIEEKVPLAPYTTFHIGGPARFFARVRSVEELRKSLDFARDTKLATLVLGGGSNVLIDDAGFDGLVIKIELRGITEEDSMIIAGAGEEWDALVSYAIQKKLWGIENLSGIPGSVGGAVAGSIGAYGQAVAQTIAWVEVFDRDSGVVEKKNKAECAFGYRESIFGGPHAPLIILRAAFALHTVPKPELSYKDLKLRFADAAPSLAQIRETVLAIRKTKFPDLSEEGTAGSFFKNPIVRADEAEKLKKIYPEMPLFAIPEAEGVKIPLAWLLDRVLDLKGMRIGGARLFEHQPLVIAVDTQASSHDVRMLAEHVKALVKEKFQIEIKEEVRMITRERLSTG